MTFQLGETMTQMLDAIETATRIAPRNGGLELGDWETTFIASVTDRVGDGNLSEKQIEKLTEIYDKT